MNLIHYNYNIKIEKIYYSTKVKDINIKIDFDYNGVDYNIDPKKINFEIVHYKKQKEVDF